MPAQVEELVNTLLYEGYALYPYTQGGSKNSTPTPFGIVYPPPYAETQPAAYSMLRMECILKGGPEASIRGSVRFLQATGEGHEAGEHRIELAATKLAALVREPVIEEFSFDGSDGPVSGKLEMSGELLGPDVARVKLGAHNTTDWPPAGADEPTRNEALVHSMLSVHPLLEVEDGRFVSPLEREGEIGDHVEASETVNTYPVLAADDSTAVLGTAIILPDNPQLAPETIGTMFDNTEIEEALVLHVQTLSDDEREDIAEGDPKVREMIERADKVTPEQLEHLHGRLTYYEEGDGSGASKVPDRPIGAAEAGSEDAEIEGTLLRKGDKVILRPGTDRDVFDKMVDGRTATIERIYNGYAHDTVYFGVTVDDDPGQELLRETSRYLFFFSHEIELPPK
ncbi:MAG: hypothetical protein M3M99_06255 [Actinomycetota bacterium]|nr:hypothetical protein [Actinomycetota bacterium]